MSRYIDADELKASLEQGYYNCVLSYEAQIFSDLIDELSTIDVAEVRRGKWDSNEFGIFCSNCNEYISDEQYEFGERLYCPHCGARMDGDSDV